MEYIDYLDFRYCSKCGLEMIESVDNPLNYCEDCLKENGY